MKIPWTLTIRRSCHFYSSNSCAGVFKTVSYLGCWYLQSGVIADLRLGPTVANRHQSVVIKHMYGCLRMRWYMRHASFQNLIFETILLTIYASTNQN